MAADLDANWELLAQREVGVVVADVGATRDRSGERRGVVHEGIPIAAGRKVNAANR